MITLNTLRLPDGLRWSDEFSWAETAQTNSRGLTGAYLVQQGTKKAGRPITLVGGQTWAWMRRSDLLALRALVDGATYPTGLTLTLHDGRTFKVLPDQSDTKGAIDAAALPIVMDSGPADPQSESRYVLNEIRLVTIA